MAGKHRTNVARVTQHLRDGPDLSVKYMRNGMPAKVTMWRLKHLKCNSRTWGNIDSLMPYTGWHLARTDVLDRLNARKCEYCDETDVPCEVHHVRKMADMRGTPLWTYLKAARTRKRIVLCQSCHRALHRGLLPDIRPQAKGVESRVQ